MKFWKYAILSCKTYAVTWITLHLKRETIWFLGIQNLSHVQAVSQLIWAHTSPSKSWILWTCLAMFLTFRRCMGFHGCPPFSSHPSIELNWIQLNWISLFIISYVIIKLHNSSHLLNVCLNNANRMQGKNVLACTIDTDFKYVINMCSICVPHKFWNLMMAEFWKKICW